MKKMIANWLLVLWQERKLAARRLALKWLRRLFDTAEDRLHAAEVRLRDELSLRVRVESPRAAGRKGQRCRVLVRSRTMNSALIEFQDGLQSNVSRNALRRGKMKATLESTSKMVELETREGCKMPARIWEGVTESGIPFHAFIIRVGVHKDLDATQFERELQEVRSPARQWRNSRCE